MKPWQVIASLALAFVLLLLSNYIVNKAPAPLEIVSSVGQCRMSHIAPLLHKGSDIFPVISARVTAPYEPKSLKVYVYYRLMQSDALGKPISYSRLPMPLASDAIDDYDLQLSGEKPGARMNYFIQAEDTTGKVIATLPADTSSAALPILEFEGVAPAWLLVLQILSLYAGVFSASLTTLSAASIFNEPDYSGLLGKQAFWTAVFLVAGGLVFTSWVNTYFFGGNGWRGWPGESPLLVVVVAEIAIALWAALTIFLMLPSVSFPKGDDRRLLRLSRYLIFTGFALTILIVLLPLRVSL